jgi:glucosamine-6-phosphate deaminase
MAGDEPSAVLCDRRVRRADARGYFAPDNPMARNRDVWQYLDGVAACNPEMKDEGCARRFLRNLYSAYTLKKADRADTILKELLEYFRTQYPGKQDPPIIQQLKGMCREWEVECLWGDYGWKCDNVPHLRLGFYTATCLRRNRLKNAIFFRLFSRWNALTRMW